MFPGIWFGKLQDGTECSVVDWHCFDIPVVQVARVRVPAVMLDEAAMGATQALRKRHPELNRQELPALYASTRFARYNVPEEEAVKAVVVNVQQLPYSKSNRENGDEHVLQFITKTILHKHPGSFSRLGWRIDIFYAATTLRGDNTITAWFVFSVAHSIADGPAMHVIVDDYLQAFGKIQQSKLPFYEYPVEPLPLYSSQPRDRLPFSKFQLYTVLIQSLLVGFLLMILPLQVMKPKLLTPMAAKHAQQVQRQRIHDGMPQRSGPFHIDILEMTVEETQQICMHAHAVSTTVGSLLMGCLFVAVSKRYFQEHPSKQILSLLIPVPVNMRPHMIPPLSTCVLAPQQGNVTITLFTSRDALEIALHSDIAMTAFMQDFARSAQTQVHKALHPSERLAVADSMLVVSNLYRICFDKFRTVQYMGDICLSNIGLYRPSQQLQEYGIAVETTYTISTPIITDYECFWSNTTLDGTMCLSVTTDETMGRNRESCSALLQDMRQLLLLMIHKQTPEWQSHMALRSFQQGLYISHQLPLTIQSNHK